MCGRYASFCFPPWHLFLLKPHKTGRNLAGPRNGPQLSRETALQFPASELEKKRVLRVLQNPNFSDSLPNLYSFLLNSYKTLPNFTELKKFYKKITKIYNFLKANLWFLQFCCDFKLLQFTYFFPPNLYYQTSGLTKNYLFQLCLLSPPSVWRAEKARVGTDS